MPFEMKRYPFTRPVMEYAPYDVSGVYILWDGDEVIYIGRTGGAHETELLALFTRENRRDPRCPQKANLRNA